VSWPRRLAAILLFARAGWTGAAGVSLLGGGALLWFSRSSGDSSPQSQAFAALLTFTFAGALALLGLIALAIAVPAAAFGALVLTRKRWAAWVVIFGECAVAIGLAVATILIFTQSSDHSLAIATVALLALGPIPVIVLLATALGKPIPAVDGGSAARGPS
jgi:hypothetical protein